MKMKNNIVSWLIFVSCVSAGSRLSVQTVSWDDCVQEAKRQNPAFLSSLEKVKQTGADLTIAKSGYFPTIDGTLSAQTTSGSQATLSATNGEKSYSYGVSGRQLLFDGFKTRYSVALSSENVKASLYAYAVTSANIRLNLRRGFINLLKAQAAVDIAADISIRRKQNLELVVLGYEAGREHKGSFFTAQANAAEAEFEVERAKRNLVLAQRELSTQLGRVQYTPLTAEGELIVPSVEQNMPDFEKMAESTPLLRKLIIQKEQARLRVNSVKADYYPKIYANASSNMSDDSWPPDTDRWSMGVNVSVPIFSGGSQVAAIDKSKSAFSQAQAEEHSGRNEVILTLADTWIRLQDALGAVSVQQKFLNAAEERAKIVEAQYKAGLISFDNWIIIEDDLIRTKRSLLDAQANALLSEANWEQAKGVTLDE